MSLYLVDVKDDDDGGDSVNDDDGGGDDNDNDDNDNNDVKTDHFISSCFHSSLVWTKEQVSSTHA